ncbi:MAG: thioredoxin family protein [Coriobacteriia bacterium]|nr:thioredoxin family protein [Coriobacteriia bacterium]
MVIKVLGSGCANCQKLEALAAQAVADLGLDAEVLHVTDIAQIMGYGVMSTPALVVDEQVKISGRVPSLAEVVAVLRDSAK